MPLVPDQNKKIKTIRRPFRLITAIEVGWDKYGNGALDSGDEGIEYKGLYYPLHWFESTARPDWEKVYRLDGFNELYIRRYDEDRVTLGTWGHNGKFDDWRSDPEEKAAYRNSTDLMGG